MCAQYAYLCVTGFSCVRNAKVYPVVHRVHSVALVNMSVQKGEVDALINMCVTMHTCRCTCFEVPPLSNMNLLHACT